MSERPQPWSWMEDHPFEGRILDLQRFAMVTTLGGAGMWASLAGPPLRWAVAINATNHHAAPTFNAEQQAFFRHLNRWELRLWGEAAGTAQALSHGQTVPDTGIG